MWNLAKKSRQKNSKKVLAFDLGGTKLSVAVVDSRGKILVEKREPVFLAGGFKGLVEQLAQVSLPLIREHRIKKAAIASAGPLDPVKGALLNPTNLKTEGREWGVVPLARAVEKKIRIPVRLENDAAAATLAERWVGVGRKVDNFIVVTLGTGVGVGVMANGHLVRSGRQLHTEAGHITLDMNDREWRCGCGNYGCAESFLSGMNFTARLAAQWKDFDLTGEMLVRRARNGEEKVLREFRLYGQRLASFIYSLVVMFSPEKVILSGGFSHSADLFLPDCEKELLSLLRTRRQGVDLLPKIHLSKFRDEAGLLGAAFVALSI